MHILSASHSPWVWWVPLPMRTVSEAVWETWVSDQVSVFLLASLSLIFTVTEASIDSYQL